MFKLKSYTPGISGLLEHASPQAIADLKISNTVGMMLEDCPAVEVPYDALTSSPAMNDILAMIDRHQYALELYVSSEKAPSSLDVHDIMIRDIGSNRKSKYANLIALYHYAPPALGIEIQYYKHINSASELMRNAIKVKHFSRVNTINQLYLPELTHWLAYRYAVDVNDLLVGPSTLEDLYVNLSGYLGFLIPRDVWNTVTSVEGERSCNWETIHLIGLWMLAERYHDYLLTLFERDLTHDAHPDRVEAHNCLLDDENIPKSMGLLRGTASDQDSQKDMESLLANNPFKNNPFIGK